MYGPYLVCLRPWLKFPMMTLVCLRTSQHLPIFQQSCGQRWCLWSCLSTRVSNTADTAFYLCQWDFQELHLLSETRQIITIKGKWTAQCDLAWISSAKSVHYNSTVCILHINQDEWTRRNPILRHLENSNEISYLSLKQWKLYNLIDVLQ